MQAPPERTDYTLRFAAILFNSSQLRPMPIRASTRARRSLAWMGASIQLSSRPSRARVEGLRGGAGMGAYPFEDRRRVEASSLAQRGVI